jgi:RNA polymerase sigma-70 factor (ECF subfamily)
MPEPLLRPLPPLADGIRRSSPSSRLARRDHRPPVAHEDLDALVQAARDGDQQAFTRLVDATYVGTYTLALRMTGDPEDARDVTQDAYLRAYRSLDRFRGDAQFTTWLYRITANCASTSMKRRRRHRHEELGTEGAELVDLRHDVDPELRADASELRGRVLDALDRLPAKLRAVVVLRDVYELSHEAIATELGISTTAAKVRLHRARLRLRSEVFPEPAKKGASDAEPSEDGSKERRARAGRSGAREGADAL